MRLFFAPAKSSTRNMMETTGSFSTSHERKEKIHEGKTGFYLPSAGPKTLGFC
jgi:hypothetical protein